MVKSFSSITDALVSRIMNWKYLLVSTISILCFFLFLATVWHDLVDQDSVNIYLKTTVVTPKDGQ